MAKAEYHLSFRPSPSVQTDKSRCGGTILYGNSMPKLTLATSDDHIATGIFDVFLRCKASAGSRSIS